MDVSVLGTWNTCNLGLMTRDDKLWACIVQRRFRCLAGRGRRILLHDLTPHDNQRIFPPRSRSFTNRYVNIFFLHTPNRSETPRFARLTKEPAARSTTRLASPCAFRLAALSTVFPTPGTTEGINTALPYWGLISNGPGVKRFNAPPRIVSSVLRINRRVRFL